MFANTFQSGFISIFYSVGSSPLQLWDKQVKNGHIRRVVDDEVKSLVLEISGTNVATTYITCPIKPRLSLGIRLPFLVMIIKNMKKYFTFEIQILDDKDMHRRFRVSNFQSTTKVRPFCTTMPIGLSSGWNQVQFNLADFTKRAYGSTYVETTRVQLHANVRIRRIYFSDVLYSDEELPNEYKLFVPTPGTQIAQRVDKVPPAPPGKKPPKQPEKKEPSKLPDEEIQIQATEKEIPSGALPSPVGEDSPLPPEPQAPEPVVIEPPLEPLENISEVPEPPSESEPGTSVEGTTEGVEPESADATTPEAPPEAPPAEGEEFVDASDQPPTEAPEEKPPAEAAEGEATPAEAPPAEEATPAAPPTEETPAAPPAEEAPAEAPAAEEPPAEAPAVEEAPTEAPAEAEQPAETAADEAPPVQPQEAPPAEETPTEAAPE